MRLVSLSLNDVDEILQLEEKMYWQGEEWKKLWEKEAKEKFRAFINDYLTNFPEGCFGLVGDSGELLGAIFLIKTSRCEPIPYLHEVAEYLKENGEIAYVSLFVIRKGDKEEEIAQELYDEAEKVALTKLGCKKIVVVIYSSPLEERVLKGNNYERLEGQFEWEIYPGKKVPCWIYCYELLMRREG
jgi:hypothetical protein